LPQHRPTAASDIALSLTSYEAATLELLAALGLSVYEGNEISEMTRDLLDRIPPAVLRSVAHKIGMWSAEEH